MKFRWPLWLPHPHACLETIILSLLMSPLALSVKYYGKLGFNLAVASDNLGPLALGLAMGVTAPFVAFAYIHNWLWGHRPDGWPKNLPSPRSIWEAFYALAVTIVATTASLIVMLFLLDLRRVPTEEQLNSIGSVGSVVWILAVLYLYQIETLLWRSIGAELRIKAEYQGQNPTKSQSQQKSPTSQDEVDIELNRLRGQMGIHQVKGKTKPQNPSK